MTVLELKAKHDALQKIATTRDPIRAISEFIWNALDADSTRVSISLDKNGLGGIEGITILDDGTGITRDRALQTFESLGESWKRRQSRTAGSRALHGKEGQGRLRFFSIAGSAEWKTTYNDTSGLKSLRIFISGDSLQRSEVLEIATPKKAKTGTVVHLAPLKDKLDWLTDEPARQQLTSVFAPYLIQYPNVKIILDGVDLNPGSAISHHYQFPEFGFIGPSETIPSITLKVIEWNERINDRRIYFGNEDGIVLGSLPASVMAPDFHFSAYAYAPFFQEISDNNMLEIDNLGDQNFVQLVSEIRRRLGAYFKDRQAEKASGLIQDLKNAGVYPYAGEPASEVEKRERQVLDIAIHAVSSYSSAFKKADNPTKRMTLGLLKESVRHNPESIHTILHHVFKLPKNKQDEFSVLLQRTDLGNIISASTLIADRVLFLEVLKNVVFNPRYANSLRERGELDKLVQSNTWIFGENFHITLPEAGLSRVMDRVAEDLHGRQTRTRVRKPNGTIGRVDTFLGRIVPHPDHLRREFLLVELKRPSLTVGRKELDQLEDYVNAMRRQPDFNSTSTYWNFFLVTGSCSEEINDRITQDGRPQGVFLQKDTYTVWVKTWAQIIRECEARAEPDLIESRGIPKSVGK